MEGTVQMGYVCQIAFKPLFANLAIEDLLFLILLALLYPAYIFVDVETLLSLDQHALVASSFSLLRCRFLGRCFVLLQMEFAAAPFIDLSMHDVLRLARLTHQIISFKKISLIRRIVIKFTDLGHL